MLNVIKRDAVNCDNKERHGKLGHKHQYSGGSHSFGGVVVNTYGQICGAVFTIALGIFNYLKVLLYTFTI